jgi:hypothetical protein
MSVCLTNAPTTFMQIINDMFFPLLDKFFDVYLHDILVFHKTRSDYMQHVNNFGPTLPTQIAQQIEEVILCPNFYLMHGFFYS